VNQLPWIAYSMNSKKLVYSGPLISSSSPTNSQAVVSSFR